MKILNVVGARPNFMKIAPLVAEMKKFRSIRQKLVHTGQHYDQGMSEIFFRQLRIPRPDMNLEVRRVSRIMQVSEIMKRFEPVVRSERPDVVLVVGDVSSTFACAFVASHLGIKVAHVEAGLRSFDRTMPEELNRVLTDQLADLLFATERSAVQNLLGEGVPRRRIFLVGNVMVDTLHLFKESAFNSDILARVGFGGKTVKAPYGIVTLHRPSNVDQPERLSRLLRSLRELGTEIPLFFPVHPRTRTVIRKWGLRKYFDRLRPGPKRGLYMLEPLGYLDFLCMMGKSSLVLTDSGGIQEETTVLGVPCLTLRQNTERPITLREGTNHLVGTDPEKILRVARFIIHKRCRKGKRPEYWDGRAAERIVKIMLEYGPA